MPWPDHASSSCCEDYAPGDTILLLNCGHGDNITDLGGFQTNMLRLHKPGLPATGHRFHKACAEKWLREFSGTCPLCRTPVS